MPRARRLSPDSIEKLRTALKAARTAAQLERVLSVWLRASLGLNAGQIATAIGWAPGAVRRFQARYLKEGDAAFKGPGRGGRRHEYMTRQAEVELLHRFLVDTHGGPREAGAIHLAYEQAAGRTVPRSTIYRMLARHGWRKSAVGSISPKKR